MHAAGFPKESPDVKALLLTYLYCFIIMIHHYSYNGYAYHFRHSIDVIPNGMWNAAFNKEGFILMDNHLFFTQQYLCLALSYDKQMVMIVGVQFGWLVRSLVLRNRRASLATSSGRSW